MQTEYFACADIAIYSDITEHFDNLSPQSYSYETLEPLQISQNNTSPRSRSKRTAHAFPYERSAGIRYTPAFPRGMQLRMDQQSLRTLPEQPQVKWLWSISKAKDGPRQRRQMQVPEGISIANPHLNGIIAPPMNGGGRVRSSFNKRQNGPLTHNRDSLNTIIISKPVARQTQAVRTIVRPIAKISLKRVRVSKPTFTVNTITNTQKGSPVLSLPKPTYPKRNAHRNFIDPLAKKVSTQTQRVLSRSNYKPTKQCMHCPFDQCLDDKLRIDHLFPGLFDSPTQFFECKRFERVFTLGNYDVVQEGFPSCQHPRFKRQLSMMQFDDDDIGCCAT